MQEVQLLRQQGLAQAHGTARAADAGAGGLAVREQEDPEQGGRRQEVARTFQLHAKVAALSVVTAGQAIEEYFAAAIAPVTTARDDGRSPRATRCGLPAAPRVSLAFGLSALSQCRIGDGASGLWPATELGWIAPVFLPVAARGAGRSWQDYAAAASFGRRSSCRRSVCFLGSRWQLWSPSRSAS